MFPDYLEHPEADSWLQRQLARFYEQVPFDGLWLDMNEAANFCGGLNCQLDYSNNTALYCEWLHGYLKLSCCFAFVMPASTLIRILVVFLPRQNSAGDRSLRVICH